MKEKLKTVGAYLLAFVVVPLGLGWAALLYINNLLKYKR